MGKCLFMRKGGFVTSPLPAGYTRLEWIESTGTQYIDTGVYAKGNQTKVVADVEITYGSGWTMILGSYNDGALFSWWGNGSALAPYYGSSNQQQAGMTGRGVLTADKNVWSYGDTSMTFSESAFTASSTMYLFSINAGGNYANASMKLYSCQIYDDGTLVRDYVPCVSPAGAVGLYDMVGGQFYGNSGTGTFTAGPEVPQGPDTPKNLTAARADDTHFTLSWDAVWDADGYKVYRDGVLASTQTATNYTAVVELFQIVTFAVAAYNDDGESGPITLTVKNFPDNVTTSLITDRTQADVDRVAYLRGRVNGGTATEAEKAEWETALKGAYNAGDLNRVGSAVDYLAKWLTDQGYAVYVAPTVNYLAGDIPTESQMERYLADVREIRGKIAVMDTTPEAPASMDSLTYGGANDIEQILVDVSRLITNLEKSWYCSGEVCAGEI